VVGFEAEQLIEEKVRDFKIKKSYEDG